MNNAIQETFEDIVREMRKRSEEVYAGQAGYPESWKDQMNDDEIREIADRIEAAAKREREAGAEAAQICGEIGEIVGREAACRQPVTDCNALNAAAMREALEKVRRVLHCAIVADILKGDDVNVAFNEVIASLSAPPRNCDAFSKAQVLEMLEDRSFSKEDTIEWLFDEAKGETDGSK